ncbi:hypothetical protein [Luteipulveratus flavus]|uniref:Uncharacterized protein n=1 Tax=Luteipulveratus flavus TaxID=3031728 RepID=A0ABT6C4V2_9MICO|nr:hypothetical protein [Luteipulveratus sp. YIM 133296]MDF8263736.1 hypothetical protein [Luteipulveratus sp. YIM 133296]
MTVTTTVPASGGLRMSLADVARLTQVQRAVVTMWRKRTNRAGVAFPEPVGTRSGHAEFDAFEVARWLEATGLGNNPDAPADVVAHARPSEAMAASASYDVVTALLALAAASHEQLAGLDRDEVLDLAEDVDADDAFLLTEAEALPQDCSALLAYVDRLADAAYSPERALDLVTEQHRRLSGGAARRHALRSEARELVSRTACAVAEALDLSSWAFVDPTRGGCDLLLATALAARDAQPVTVLTGEYASVEARRARRRLRAHDLAHEPCAVQDGVVLIDRPAVVVAHLPDPARPGMAVGEILREVDELTLQMGAEQWALVLAPASALSDRLRSDADERARDAIMRDGRLRMVLRLPAGMATHLGQQQLTLWLLGPAHPDVPPSERRTVLGDLTGVELTEAVYDEVATDAVAALAPPRLAAAHRWHHGSTVLTSRLVRQRGGLMTFATAEPVDSRTDSAAAVLAIDGLRTALDVGAAWTLGAGEEGRRQTVTVQHAQEIGALRVLSGHRIRAHDVRVGAGGGVAVIGPDEVSGSARWGERRIDRFDLEATYPGSRLTEPGDVVFATSGRVVARVDRRGGSVVQAPARVMRLRAVEKWRGALSPDVVAADLNAQPRAGNAYRAWQLRIVSREATAPLADAVADIEAMAQEAQRRLADLRDLRTRLVDGVAAGAVTMTDQTRSIDTQHDSTQRAGR